MGADVIPLDRFPRKFSSRKKSPLSPEQAIARVYDLWEELAYRHMLALFADYERERDDHEAVVDGLFDAQFARARVLAKIADRKRRRNFEADNASNLRQIEFIAYYLSVGELESHPKMRSILERVESDNLKYAISLLIRQTLAGKAPIVIVPADGSGDTANDR